MRFLLPVVLLSFTLGAAQAAEPAAKGDGVAKVNQGVIKKAVEAKLKGAKVDSVSRTPYAGLYEVVIGRDVLYTDDKASFIIEGRIIDTKSMVDVTAERLEQLSVVDFKSLPLEQAVKMLRGNGARTLVTFEDPNCVYCKRYAKELAKLENVTIYTFLYPVLSPDSLEKSNAVWCAPDRARAWLDLMLSEIAPAGSRSCETPVQAVLKLGQQLRINGTPTTIFPDGRVQAGLIQSAELEKRLAAATAKKR